MKIAHLTWSLGIGGAQTLLVEIANIQVQSGCEVAIFEVDTYVSEAIVKKFDPRIKIFYLGRVRGKKAIMPFVRLNWHLWRYKPDIIHSHAGKLINVVFNSAPKIATIHGMKDFPRDYVRYNQVYAISKSVHDDWVKKGNDKTIVIENGIKCDSIKQKWNFKLGKEVHVAVVSRIYLNVKGQDIVVKALAKLKEIQKNLNCENKELIVHFIGGGVDTDKLRKLASELGVNEQIVLEGFKDPDWVLEHLCNYDLFVQASRWEGFGLTVAEACVAKLPVIISNIDGPLEILDGGRLGMTFKSGDSNDLAEKLLDFLNEKYNYSLIEQAYKHSIEKYNIKNTAKRYMQEYKKILDVR